jgi:hypothetical protein
LKKVHVKIEQPEWLDKAIPEVLMSLRLIAEGKVPEVLKGRFIVADCKRLLRCVYGSDLDAVLAIRTEVLDDVAFWQEVESMTPEQAKAFFAAREAEALEPKP